MREDSVQYAQAARSPSKEPRYVIRIVFDTDSPALTSHAGIDSVPGDVIESVLQEPSATSQRIIPDEGRSEIGSFSFSLIDKDAAFTEKLREKLFTDFEGIRGKKVIFYDGYRGFDFTDFQVFQTQIVQGVSYADGVYKVRCQDITREQRKDIFEPKFTTLRDSVSDSATTIPVYVTDDFETVVHGTSWSDAPSSTVGYIRVENEIIRYTGKTSNTFTGCTRGVLNTKAVAHSVDAGTAEERRAKVEEYIYLELPAVKMGYAILTGELVTNIVPNPSFEIDETSNGVPDLWTDTSNGSGITIAVSLPTSPVIRGSKAFKLEVTSITPPTAVAVHSRVTTVASAPSVVVGRSYSVSCYAQTSTLTYSARVQIDWIDSGGTTLSSGTHTHVFSATGSYERIATPEYEAPVGAVGARFRAGIVRPSTSETTLGYLIFDDYQCLGPSGNVLPAHWHLGIDPIYIRESDFALIGPDLWDPSDDSVGLTLRFEGLKKTDGKRFLEKEIYLPLGCYSPVYSDGALGLRRLPALIADSAPVVILTEREVISHGDLQHDLESMHNVFRINWNWDVLKEQFTRISYFADTDSITINGSAPIKEYSFKGLHGSRHTDVVVQQRLAALRDAYAYPPERIQVTVQGSLSYLEIGDVVQLRLQNVRDYAGAVNPIDRAFAIFHKSHDSARNQVTLDLFGSTARPLATAPGTGVTAPLPDAFYTAIGTNLSTIAAITTDVMATGSYTITGSSNLTSAAAVFYHAGDLTIPSGCNLTITGNVQLRIMGFLQLNGTINGVGGGHPGVADGGGTTPSGLTYPGNPGFVGSTRAWDGVIWFFDNLNQLESANPAPVTRALNDAAPVLNLSVSGNTLQGLPTDLRGTGGGAGGRTYRTSFPPDPNLVLGGTGGNGGAGLAIICRGMAFGVSASINLSGASTTNPAFTSPGSSGRRIYPGAGAPGGPGALYLLLDGNSISIPDISGKFTAAVGTLTQAGAYLLRKGLSTPNWQASNSYSGYADPGVTAGLDLSNAAHQIQYIPETQTPADDTGAVPPPTGLTARSVVGGNSLAYTIPDPSTFDVIEAYASIDNDRSNASKAGETRASSFLHSLPLGGLRYYWIRARRTPDPGRPPLFSEWEPESATAGVVSNAETAGEIEEAPADFTATGKTNGIQFNWSLPWAKLVGKLVLYEHTASTPFSSATAIWEGYALGVFIPKTDTTTRYYWLVLERGGIQSVPEPPVTGLAAAASASTSALSVDVIPDAIASSAGVPPPNPKSVTTTSATATATGGTGPYTYAWTWFAGGTGLTINSASSATTSFTGSNVFDGTTKWGIARCTVTDAASATASDTVEVQINWPSAA